MLGESLADASLTAAFVERADAAGVSSARVVIIGAGIIGSSVAYHLSALGWSDIVVLDRAKVASGTTWHAAGLLAQIRVGHAMTELARYGPELYAALEAETGIPTGCNRSGSLTLARTEERMIELRYVAAMGRHHSFAAELVGSEEAASLFPLLDPRGVVGGVYAPGDGTTNPGWSALALAQGAHNRGVRFFEHERVTEFLRRNGRVVGVRTDQREIGAEVVVLCAGLWSRELGLSIDVPVPVYPAEHMWVQTASLDGSRPDAPYLRDLDNRYYVRHYRGGALIGAFEPNGKPRPPEMIPLDFCFGEFEPDVQHFDEPLGKARSALPALRDVEITRFLNGPESFTPDNQMLLGEAPELRGLFVAAGMNSQGIIYAPGVGRALAEWIVEGAPTFDASEVDVARFAPEQNADSYLFARTRESLGLLYGMHWPEFQPETARDLRRTPLYTRLAARGARFGQAAGWERANWYGDEPIGYSYGKPSWFDAVGVEHRAARERVALFDLSTFTKLDVRGSGALAHVQSLLSSALDVPVGRVVYTTMLNVRGGIETDLTVARLAADRFFVVAPTLAHRKVGNAFGAAATDLTINLGTIGIFGPQSRALLAALTPADLSNDAFPFSTAQAIELAGVDTIALRISYAGELGWELYVPVADLGGVYDVLLAQAPDLTHAGYFALDSLRLEKGFRSWGHDIGSADSPLDVGLGFTVANGTTARDREPARTMVHVLLRDPDELLHHGESVYRDGRIVGRVTSGAYGYTLGGAVGLATIEVGAALDGAAFAVDVAGRLVPAELSARAFYDPAGARMRTS